MRSFTLLLFLGLSLKVFSVVPKENIPFLTYKHSPPTEHSYNEEILLINNDRKSLLKNKINLDSCKKYFLEAFENKVFPHWV